LNRRLPIALLLLLLLLLAGATRSPALVSDDFNRNNLDTGRWTFVNPLSDGWVAMEGAGTGDARLSLSLPEGDSHDPWQMNRAVRVMQPAADADFGIEARFASQPSLRYQMQGFIIEEDEDDWIRVEVLHDGSALSVFAAVTVSGASSAVLSVPIADGAAEFLRVDRSGDDWTVSAAGGDTAFASVGSFAHAMTVTAAGLHVANHASGEPAPAFTAVFDYVFDTKEPVMPEDGDEEPDVLPPFNHNASHAAAGTDLMVSWNTDEAALGSVAYGTTTGYEIGVVSESGFAREHAVVLPGLVPGDTYHYRICSEDDGERSDCLDDVEVLFHPAGPDIAVWYGEEQSFGANGRPQPWVNIPGNAGDPDGVSALSYTLNGGPAVPLSMGPDGRRLVNAGDFNVDLSAADLSDGANTVAITAWDGAGNETTAVVAVDYTGGVVSPLPYSIDWGTLSADEQIQDVSQVVDGRWGLEGSTVRILEPGYDRLIAVGDSAWTNVEFLVPVTLNSSPGDFGTGVLLRWNGHTDDPVICEQPKCGYFPLGAIIWLRPGLLEIYGNYGIIYDAEPMTVESGVTYWLRGGVQTQAGGSVYSAKAWEDGMPEPPEWDVVGQSNPGDPVQGSLLLLSHQADASFGALHVAEIETPNVPPTAGDDLAFVAPGDSADVSVLNNDYDIDGTIDSTSVTISDGPFHGTANADPVTGVIRYVHDGSPASSDSLIYTVLDDDGDVSNPARVAIVISADPPLPTSDDFNRCDLDSMWTFHNPLDDGAFALIGTGDGDARLELSLPAGTPHNVWGPGGLNETVRILQETSDIDIRIDVKWKSEPTDGYNDQGIIVEQDSDNWLRFDVFHDGSSLFLFVGKTIAGGNTTLLSAAVPDGSTLHLRVNRQATSWTTSTSADGMIWQQRHDFQQPLSVRRLGVYAGNPVEALAAASEIDYFLVAADPFAEEDGDVNEIVVDIVGQGSVELDPQMPDYDCGDVVEITAVADSGWTFTGWSGDLTGSENPAFLEVTGAMAVTALFDAAASAAGPPADPGVLGAVGVSPNPSTGSAVVRFRLGRPAEVKVVVTDLAGRVVRRLLGGRAMPEGAHELSWDGRTDGGAPAASGVYFLRIEMSEGAACARLLRIE
jgi:regulation of enolase protein 1 (concanavalin A-like superfamily)